MSTLTQNKNFTIRLDVKVKEEAERLFADLGMTLSVAMNIFLHQALIVGAFRSRSGRNVRTRPH